MNPLVPILLLAACAVLMVLEWRGVRTTLELHFKGDVKRETRWLAQYGQSVCTPIAALLAYQLDAGDPARRLSRAVLIVAGGGGAAGVAVLVKRTLGRGGAGREKGGGVLGAA